MIRLFLFSIVVFGISFPAFAEMVKVTDPNKQLAIVAQKLSENPRLKIKALYSFGSAERGYFVTVDLIYKNSDPSKPDHRCQTENIESVWEDKESGKIRLDFLMNGGQECLIDELHRLSAPESGLVENQSFKAK